MRRSTRLALAALPWAALAGMLVAGWGRRGDVLHDFGRELYLAWRVSEGDVLYRDLAHFNGPLSVWGNAAAFRLFGTGIRTLVLLNTLLLAAGLALLQRLLSRVASPLAACAAATAFATLCGAASLTGIGGFDFVAPYSHEATHGFLLAGAALLALLRFREAPSAPRALLAGLLAGLVLLTKVEISLALGLAVLAGIALPLPDGSRPSLRHALLLASSAAAAPAAALALLAASMTPGEAARALTVSWRAVFSGRLAADPFYRTLSGTADLAGNALRLALVAASEAALVAAAVFAARRSGAGTPGGPPPRGPRGAAFFAAALLLVAGLAVLLPDAVLEAFRPLPLCAGAAVLLALRRKDSASAVLSLFAAAAVLKIAGRCGIHHYGFFLAAPALLAAVVLLLDGVPELARLAGRPRALFRAAACGALAGLLLLGVLRSVEIWRLKTTPVLSDRPADRFLADTRGEGIDKTLAELRALVRPGETLACLPEGTMINFLLRLGNPSPYFVVLPPEAELWGSGTIVDSYRRTPPDWIVLHQRRMEEYGFRSFGRDFLPEMGSWIASSYRPEVLIGEMPAVGAGFGLLVLRRRDLPATSAPVPP